MDDVVAIEEAWVSSLDAHFMRKGYDELLAFVATRLKSDMNVNISRAQAWVLLNILTENGVPEALRQEGIDEEINKGSLAKDIAKAPFRAAATVVDTAANTVSDVAKGTASMASNAVSAVMPSSDEEETEESSES